MPTLPRTFQDALEKLYELDFRYLWLESLCITQNKYEYWRQNQIA